MPDNDDIHRSADDAVFDDHGLDRALAEAITQTSVDEADTTVSDERSDSPASRKVFRWRLHEDGGCGRNTIIGIDFSQTHVVLLEQAEGRDGPYITGILVHEVDGSHHSSSFADVLCSYGAPPGTRVHVSMTSPRAVVRRFTLPKVSKKQREAAACWEARKLIPFPLSETDSLHGFHFEPMTDAGWMVTLAALPREDVGHALECVSAAEWTLETVSIAGTKKRQSHKAPDASESNVAATLLWSPQRSSFVVFKGDDLRFHYDLGNVPPPDILPGQPLQSEDISRWLSTLRKSTGEAIEFYGGSHTHDAISRIELVGIPESAAPLITDWNELFDAVVAVAPTPVAIPKNAPDHVQQWYAQYGDLLTPAALAMSGATTIDLTPTGVRQHRQSHKLERIGRSVLVVSLMGIIIWSGLLWMQRSLAARSHAQLVEHIQALETSSINEQIQACVAGIQRVSSMRATLEQAGEYWMPDVRRVLSTLPDNARLLSLSIVPDPMTTAPGLMMRMEGVLHPNARAYSLTYADWLRAVKDLFGDHAVSLESTRTLEWKGTVKSAFVITVHPSHNANSGGRQ
ncbi:MAG: hypothetical protein GF341_07920 [candidate division Zixibacteria bacterium]|nr:hypothetical protein [candidate division Zixibacteria bacterium]